jgi:diphthine-ammonia ligase
MRSSGTRLGTRPRAAISWSGGKDSLAALAACRDRFEVVAALTMFDEAGARSRSHGLRPELIAAQADRLGLRAVTARCGWDTYNDAFRDALRALADDGVTHVVFGDLVYAEHRDWAEQRCAEAGVTAVEPLWGTPTDALFDAFVASRARALLVTVREPWLDASWLGRPLGAEMKPIFAERGIDPCGERGEYHTAVVDSPLFSYPIPVTCGETVRRGECFALDLVPGHRRQGFGAHDAAGG